MPEMLLLLAVTDTIWSRIGVCAAAVVFGALLIRVGINNVRTGTAEESGKRRLVNDALGQSNTYTGSKAVSVGWLRLILGVCVILFGIAYIFVGPVLAP